MKLRPLSLLIITATISNTTPASALSLGPLCEIIEIKGEIPCIVLSDDMDSDCGIIATPQCSYDELPELYLNGDHIYRDPFEEYGEQHIWLGDPPAKITTATLAWTRGEQFGEVTIRYKESADEGFFCAAAPPQRPTSPLAALLPLLLGALCWRRHSTIKRDTKP